MLLVKNDLNQDILRWKKALFSYIKALNFSNNTLEMYDRVLNNFEEYMLQFEEELTLRDIRAMHIIGFLSYMDDKDKKTKSKATKEVYLKALKKFFNFISDNNDEFFSYSNILKGVKLPSEKKTHEKIKHFSSDEISLFCQKINEVSDRYMDLQKTQKVKIVLLAKILFFAGLRISEALPLSYDNITEDGDFYILSIVGKGGEAQKVYILKSHINVELDHLKRTDNNLIFTRKTKKPISRQEAYSNLSSLYSEIGIKKRGCHILRHSLAMKLVSNNVNIVEIKGILRHESVQTTMKYAEASKEGAKKAAIDIAKEVIMPITR